MQRRTWIKGVGALAGSALMPMDSCFAARDELQLRFNLGMHNPGSVELPVQQVWMYLPVRRNAWWTLEGVETDLPHELQGDALGTPSSLLR